jgi:O-antigen chain-terminating methyltransferase
VLSPGGVLILETPNPETVRVGATTFYRDPTHRNPLMPEVLRFIVEHRGFAAVELLKLHPFTEGLLQEKTEDAAMLNQVLFGLQNYAIVARRP